MVTYALDVYNNRISSAMEELGISNEELICKTLEDFAGPKVSADVQALRYEYHQRQIKETVAEIREALKKTSNRRINTLNSMPIEKGFLGIESPMKGLAGYDSPDMTRKQKKALINTLSDFELAEKPIKLKNVKSEPKLLKEDKEEVNMFQLLKEKQKENLKNIKKKQIESQLILSERLNRAMKEHIDRENLIDAFKRVQNRQKDDMMKTRQMQIKAKMQKEEGVFEAFIEQKLEKIKTKIKKSEEIHQEQLRIKSDKALKLCKAGETVAKTLRSKQVFNEVDQVNRLVDKHNHVHEARLKIEDKMHQDTLSKKENFEKQRDQALQKLKKTEEALFQKSKSLEKRLEKSQQLVESRKQQILHDIVMKQEVQRLKEQEKQIYTQRAKRRLNFKAAMILQKEIEKTEKISAMKAEKLKTAEKNRDYAIKSMIHKEKVQEALFIISKSPKSRAAQDRLKQFAFLKKPETPSEPAD